ATSGLLSAAAGAAAAAPAAGADHRGRRLAGRPGRDEAREPLGRALRAALRAHPVVVAEEALAEGLELVVARGTGQVVCRHVFLLGQAEGGLEMGLRHRADGPVRDLAVLEDGQERDAL